MPVWSSDRAWEWYNRQPWPCGFNYVPAHAISYTEMWMGYNFDPPRMDRELAKAQEVGFNCLRVVLPFVVWEAEPMEFKKRVEAFLEVCHRRGLAVMPALFDDCVFGPIHDPQFGRQPDVVPGWYANGWTPSPGHAMVRNAATWSRLERYVTDLLRTFGADPRLWMWDLYNEPTNGKLGEISLPLLKEVFAWARAIDSTQPMTVGVWDGSLDRLNLICIERSDVLTFHYYGGDGPEAMIEMLKPTGRPIICTEWLNRPNGSTVKKYLPIFREQRIGCMHWGLVNGRTQTHLHWGSRPEKFADSPWLCDLFRGDLSPYDPQEIEAFKRAIASPLAAY